MARARTIAHMQNLLAAGALLGACHHNAAGSTEPSLPNGPGIDPVVPPANVAPSPPPSEPVAPEPQPRAGEARDLEIETAWLNGRQLIVRIRSPAEVKFEIQPGAAERGAVPHLATTPVLVTSEAKSPARPAAGTATVVFDDAPSPPTETWLLLRNLVPLEEVRIDVPDPQGHMTTLVTLRLPQTLGGTVVMYVWPPPVPPRPPPIPEPTVE